MLICANYLYRYSGFCPQLKYRIGETYGRTTSRLLGDEKVASSGQYACDVIRPQEGGFQLKSYCKAMPQLRSM